MTGRASAANTGPSQAAPINADRLIDHLATMAEVGRSKGGGVTRLAWSKADITARNLIAGWSVRDARAEVGVDPVGNLIVAIPGGDPTLAPIVLGSHLDTVVDAGPLDGTYGVVAAVEVGAALAARRLRLRHPLRIVAFANEEGVVASPFTGSLAVTGRAAGIDLEELGPDEVTLATRLARAGGDPARLDAAAWRQQITAYLELHIEQGPVLDTVGVPIGVVSAITGRRRAQIIVSGRANHAGTTPMDLRHDAVVAAAHAVLAVEAVAREGLTDVATVGTITARPGNANVIAGEVILSVDIRSVDDSRRDAALADLDGRLAAVARATGTTITMTADVGSPAARSDPYLMSVIAEAGAASGVATVELASGAGHDAQHLADIGPIGMIFVPSIGGISHNPEEKTAPADLAKGAEVLLATLLRVDCG